MVKHMALNHGMRVQFSHGVPIYGVVHEATGLGLSICASRRHEETGGSKGAELANLSVRLRTASLFMSSKLYCEARGLRPTMVVDPAFNRE